MLTASEFLVATASVPLPDREKAVLSMFQDGHVPSFNRYREIVEWYENWGGGRHLVGCEVSADYMMLGTDADFVRIPMRPATAQAVADLYGARLPTRKIVNKVMQHADVRLVGHPFATNLMRSNATYHASNRHIEDQLAATPEFQRGMLVAGHKKDIVVGTKVTPKNVVIYGFCKTLRPKASDPLAYVGEEEVAGRKYSWAYQWYQGEFGGHDNQWVDYSHGVRLVYSVAIDGVERTYEEVMEDPKTAVLFADTAFTTTRYPT